MKYAKLDQGAVSVYPYTLAQLRRDNPNTSFPLDPANITLSLYDVVEVIDTTLPAYDAMAERLVEGTPINNAGTWERVYTVEALTQSEIDAQQDAADESSVIKKLKKIAILQFGLIDALIAQNVLTSNDVDAKSRAVYQDLKPAIDRLRAKL